MDRLSEADMFELGRDIDENAEYVTTFDGRRSTDYKGRPLKNVEMMAYLLYKRYSFEQRAREWCDRFDKWLESEGTDGDNTVSEAGR